MGAVSVTRRAVLFAALAALTLVVALAFWLVEGGARPPGTDDDAAPLGLRAEREAPTTTLPAAAPRVDGALERLEADPLPTPVVASDAPAEVAAPRALLWGRVLRTVGESPVPDVAVSVRLEHGSTAPDDALHTRTDAAGRFELGFDHTVQVVGCLVGASADTAGSVVWRRLSVPLGGDTELTLHVGTGAALAGRVEDPDGTPLADARVLLWSRPAYLLDDDPPDRTVTTGSDGRFAFEAVGEQFVVSAEREGLLCVERLGGELAEGRRAVGLRVVLAPAASLHGRTLTPAGAALPDVRVRARPEALHARESLTDESGIYRLGPVPRETTSDAQGRFRIDGVPERPLPVEAELAGRARRELQHDPRDGELEIVLERGASLAGLVRGADGRPVAGAALSVPGMPTQRATSGDDGRFLIEGLAASDTARLQVLATGHAMQVVQPLTITPDDTAFVELQLEPGRSLAGHVVDGDGAPVVGAVIAIEGDRLIDLGNVTTFPPPTWESWLGRSRAVTDEQGAFRIDELYAGTFELVATHPADSSVTGHWSVPSGSEELELLLDPAARSGVTLVGTVRDAHTGRPVTTFQLTPMRPMGSSGMAGSNRSFSDAEGRFVWSGLDVGAFQLTASAEGYGPWSRPLQEYAEGEQVIEIALRATRELRLRCVDEAGAPLADVSLTFSDEDGRGLMVAAGVGMRSSLLSTDANGEARAFELPAGRITVAARRAGAWDEPAVEAVFDLWTALTGVQTLVVPSAAPAPHARLLRLNLASARVDPGLPPFDVSLEDRASLRPLITSGELVPLDAEVVLTYTPTSGANGTTLRFGPLPGGGWGPHPGTVGPGTTTAAGAGSVEFTITDDGGTLQIEAPGHGWRRVDVPAGSDDLMAFVVLLRG